MELKFCDRCGRTATHCSVPDLYSQGKKVSLCDMCLNIMLKDFRTELDSLRRKVASLQKKRKEMKNE